MLSSGYTATPMLAVIATGCSSTQNGRAISARHRAAAVCRIANPARSAAGRWRKRRGQAGPPVRLPSRSPDNRRAIWIRICSTARWPTASFISSNRSRSIYSTASLVAASADVGKRLLHFLLEQIAVEQAGQRIDMRQPLDLAFGCFLPRQVANDHHPSAGVRTVMPHDLDRHASPVTQMHHMLDQHARVRIAAARCRGSVRATGGQSTRLHRSLPVRTWRG